MRHRTEFATWLLTVAVLSTGCVVGEAEDPRLTGDGESDAASWSLGEGACPGGCHDPGPARCQADSKTLRTFAGSGTCVEGECQYRPTDYGCAQGCEAGACVGEPCVGVVCDALPGATCLDGNTLRTYVTRGSCHLGICDYAPTDVVCAQGCEAGACVGEPCVGVVCRRAPAPVCKDARTLVEYAAEGRCSEGQCRYATKEIPCTQGCADGRCVGDPCAGVRCDTPPASTCGDETSLRSYAPLGTCVDGQCRYVSSDTECTHGCHEGTCEGDPCVGVTCDSRPAPRCLDEVTLRTFGEGSCNTDGACDYPPEDRQCPHGCRDGACEGDPCTGVVCNEPPAARCLDGSTLRTYGGTGTCDNGSCSYGHDDWHCDHGCSGNACAPDPCAGVVCNDVPASTCVGSNYRAYSTGSCSEGTCSYPYESTLCYYGCYLPGGCLPPPSNYKPHGALDGVKDGEVWGWACDKDGPLESIQVHIYVGGRAGEAGATGYATTADRASASGVNSSCGGGSAHRFRFKIPNWTSRRDRPIYAYGINLTPGAGNGLLGGCPKYVQ